MIDKPTAQRVPVTEPHGQDIPEICDNCITLEAQLEQLAFEIDYLTDQRDRLRKSVSASARYLSNLLRDMR